MNTYIFRNLKIKILEGKLSFGDKLNENLKSKDRNEELVIGVCA